MASNGMSRDYQTKGVENYSDLHVMKHWEVDDQRAREAFKSVFGRSAETGLPLYPTENLRTLGRKRGAQIDQKVTATTASIPRISTIPAFSKVSQEGEGSRTRQASPPETQIAISTKSPLFELPSELQLKILSFLDALTLNSTSFTCRHFHNMTTPKMVIAADKTTLKRRVALMERAYRNWEPNYLVCYSCLTPQSPVSFSEDQKTLTRRLRGSAAIRRHCIGCLNVEQFGSRALTPTQFGYGTSMTLAQLLRDWNDPCQVPTQKIPTSPPPDSTWKLGYLQLQDPSYARDQ